LELALGNLDRIQRLVRITGFVACVPEFAQQHVVIDGASRALVDVFGEAGRHVRSAIGVAALPHGAAVELELTAAFT
jgi:enamine deaminase RidA (YjgF/YER057c/UK114 family)